MASGQYEYMLYAGDCHVDDARNSIVSKFLAGDCEEFVFLDDDVGWEPEDLEQLLSYDADVVAAGYPFKDDEEGYPVAPLGGLNVAREDGLVEVAAVPTGFLRIKRHVLERLAEKAQKFEPKAGRDPIPLIFERLVNGGRRMGGDFAFCKKWRDLGGKIYLAPEILLHHTGDRTWTGSWGHWKRNELYGPIKAGLFEIRTGMENSRTAQDLVRAWGNEWSGDGILIAAAIELARASKGPILEFGSGLTSLVMAAASRKFVTCLEHDDEWLERGMDAAIQYELPALSFVRSRIKDGFYSNIPEGKWGLVLMDGPPRQLGDRTKFYNFDWGDAIVLMDDLDCPIASNLFLDWSRRNGREAVITGRVGISRKL